MSPFSFTLMLGVVEIRPLISLAAVPLFSKSKVILFLQKAEPRPLPKTL